MTRLEMTLAVLLLALAGCSGQAAEETTGEVTEALPTEVNVTEVPTAVEDITGQAEEAIQEATEAVAAATNTFPLDASYSDSGFSMELTEIRFFSTEELIASMGDEGEMMADMLEAPAYITVDLTIANNSEQDADWFPGQGTLQIGSQQIEADPFLSEFPGGTVLAGTEASGTSVYGAEGDVDSLMQEGQARFVANAPVGTEDFETLASDIDLTLEWTP